jgi:hypothetical protein
MENAYLLENIIIFLGLRRTAFGFILNFDIKIITHAGVVFSLIHLNNLFALYFRDANILISFLASEAVKMNANDHHQDAKRNPDFSFFVGCLNLVFCIKDGFLKFKTLFSF